MPRSLLFVPAKEKMLKKIGQLDADVYIIDLEDSIEDELKEEALELVKKFLENLESHENIYIRVNKENYKKEIESLARISDIGFMLPKMEQPNYYEACSTTLKNHEVIALIETPLGVVKISDIVQCQWVDAVAFGAEDFSSFVNMKKNNELLRYQKGCLITYARAYGKEVYDTPSFHLGLNSEFEDDVQESVDLGFDGKLAISPKHIPVINYAFNRMNYEEIEKIVLQYESVGQAVQVIDGIVYEKMHVERLRNHLKER